MKSTLKAHTPWCICFARLSLSRWWFYWEMSNYKDVFSFASPTHGWQINTSAKIRILNQNTFVENLKNIKKASFFFKIIKNGEKNLFTMQKVCIFTPSEFWFWCRSIKLGGRLRSSQTPLNAGSKTERFCSILLKVASQGVTFIVRRVCGMWSGTGGSLPCFFWRRFVCGLWTQALQGRLARSGNRFVCQVPELLICSRFAY